MNVSRREFFGFLGTGAAAMALPGGLSAAVVGGGDAMSKVQTGNVHDYASVVLLGVAVLSVLFVVIAVILGGM